MKIGWFIGISWSGGSTLTMAFPLDHGFAISWARFFLRRNISRGKRSDVTNAPILNGNSRWKRTKKNKIDLYILEGLLKHVKLIYFRTRLKKKRICIYRYNGYYTVSMGHEIYVTPEIFDRAHIIYLGYSFSRVFFRGNRKSRRDPFHFEKGPRDLSGREFTQGWNSNWERFHFHYCFDGRDRGFALGHPLVEWETVKKVRRVCRSIQSSDIDRVLVYTPTSLPRIPKKKKDRWSRIRSGWY